MSEQLLHQILQKLDHIDSEQSFMKLEMQSMKSDMHSMKTEVQSMKSDMQSMRSDILELKESQELTRTQLGETNAIVRAIRERQEETDAKLDALSVDVHKLHGEVVLIKEGLGGHVRILEKLSLRSIEQEADIRDLKLAK